jgi:hypothetical protein
VKSITVAYQAGFHEATHREIPDHISKESSEELKAHVLTLDDVKKARAELMSRFGLDS